ncbi:hypothetical protein BG015_009710 [Linnemannia schmuckeri]|uniref:Uncharacterized protein n=1 Tax=Linnemannia schmuckeri TaxID=64567 RepID=A0A9P5V9R5_9FUNG|nr:hypothetical protein BG015_009710 [Linnemannia schmuckeri]
MSQDNTSTLPLSQRHWLNFSFSQPDHNSNNSSLQLSANNSNNCTISRSGSGLTHASSDRTLSRNITSSSAYLPFSTQTFRKQQRPTNHDGPPCSQPDGKTYSSPSVIPTLEMDTRPSISNSLSVVRESSTANSLSPTDLMADSPSSAPLTGSRSRPISIADTLSPGAVSSSQPRYSSPVRSLLPSYIPQSPARTPKYKADHHPKNLPIPGASSGASRTFFLQEKRHDGDQHQGGKESTAEVSDRGVGGSAGREQSRSSLSSSLLNARSTPELYHLMDKISSMIAVVGKFQQTFDDHIQKIKHEEARTPAAAEEACMKAVERMQQRTEESSESLVMQIEKAVLQRLDESLQAWSKTLDGQMRTSIDAIQGLVQQAQTSQSTTLQDLSANLQRTVEDCLQRFEEQVGPHMIEKVGERAIALAEKRQDLVLSIVTQTEKAVQQRLEESLRSWTETLPGQLRTAVSAIQEPAQQAPFEQRPAPQQDLNAWKTHYDARISNEISELKSAIASLNATTQQNQKMFQEQLRLTRNLNQQNFSKGRGNSGEWFTPMSHHNHQSPIPLLREGQTHPSQVEVSRHNDEHGITIRAMQPPAVPFTVGPLSNSPLIDTTASLTSPAPEQKATVKSGAKGERAQARKRAPRSATSATRSGRQNRRNTGGSAPQPLSAIAKGKQAMRREAWPQLGNDDAGIARQVQAQAQASNFASSSALPSTIPTLPPALSQSVPNLPRVDIDGDGNSYVVIQGLSGFSSSATVTKRGRGRPPKTNSNADAGLPHYGSGTSSKRMKVNHATMVSGTALAPIKIEDVIRLPSRVTRSGRTMSQTEVVYLDLETIAQQHREKSLMYYCFLPKLSITVDAFRFGTSAVQLRMDHSIPVPFLSKTAVSVC